MTFKEWINTFYHGSTRPLKIGTILKPQPKRYSLDDNIEAVLEKYRPTHRISRSQAVFLSGDPQHIDISGGYSNYIYIVEPLGRTEHSDVAWYSAVELGLDDKDERATITAAQNYWNGVRHPDKDFSVFEYRTTSAKIIKQITI